MYKCICQCIYVHNLYVTDDTQMSLWKMFLVCAVVVAVAAILCKLIRTCYIIMYLLMHIFLLYVS